MATRALLAAVLVVILAVPAAAGELTGQYVEARTCDVWTGACYANAEVNLTGRHAVMAWKIDRGEEGNVSLDGLSVVAVVEATDTLGLEQTGASKAVILVDKKANAAQREALVAVAKRLGGAFTQNVLTVQPQAISIDTCRCKEGGCALVDAGLAKIQTRCMHYEQDRICGHEDSYYPPLARGVKVKAAFVTEHSYTGNAFDKTWNDAQGRGAFIGSFSSNAR